MSTKPEPKRLKYNDQYHTYWIDGKKATGVSGVAKGFQDSYNIDRKIKRDVAKGMARRPDLCTMVAALGDDDSWETKKKIDKIATDAIEASGAWAKANHGTAKHTILERVHKGLPLDDVFDDRLLAYAEAYRALIDGSGLIPVAHLTERFVVYPELLIAGRLDCAYHFYREKAECPILLGDFKSGSRAVQYPHSIVAQLGLYLNAPFLYNEDTDEFDPAPLWGDTIVIAHVPDELDQFGLWTIDASLARSVALAALERHRYIRADADTLVKQWIVPTAPPLPPEQPSARQDVPAASPASFQVDARVGEPTAPPVQPSQPADPFDGLVDGYVEPPAAPARRQWIIDRLKVLKTAGAIQAVALRWPEGLATLRQSDRHTDKNLDRIVAVLDLVEAEYSIPFGVSDPTKEETWRRETSDMPPSSSTCASSNSSNTSTGSTTTTSLITTDTSASTAPNSSNSPEGNECESTSSRSTDSSNRPSAPSTHTAATTPRTTQHSSKTSSESALISEQHSKSSREHLPDEGPDADPDAVALLEDRYKRLPPEGRSWIAGIARDAQRSGRPITLSGTPTVRRFEIVRGLVALASASYDEDEIVSAMIEHIAYIPTTTPIGFKLSTLSADEARRFADLCHAYVNGSIVSSVDDDGRLVFTP